LKEQTDCKKESKSSTRFYEKVEKAWKNFENVMKIKKQLEKLTNGHDLMDAYDQKKLHSEEFKDDLSKLSEKVESTKAKIQSRYKKLTKQRDLDQAVLYLVQHPEMIHSDPISTERLLLCCYKSKSQKNLTIVMDMLVEAGVVITLEELEAIVNSFLQDGIECTDNIHKYVMFL
jgi:arsenate reductase-like glutaredoxin family protein